MLPLTKKTFVNKFFRHISLQKSVLYIDGALSLSAIRARSRYKTE